jgi:hypothetical protein
VSVANGRYGMRYTLSSRGRVVGHTDLDIYTITATMRQGFVEPTSDGRPLLADATGVWRALAEQKRVARARGEKRDADHDLVIEAFRRREDLDLELRDEHGNLFDCDFMRVYDLFDAAAGVVDEMNDTEEEEQAEFEIQLSKLPPERREEALAKRRELNAEAEAFVAEMLADRDEERELGSSWPPPPPEDPRWDTMQYHLQVFLKEPDLPTR